MQTTVLELSLAAEKERRSRALDGQRRVLNWFVTFDNNKIGKLYGGRNRQVRGKVDSRLAAVV
jgi:hypothetical protein